MKFTQAHLSPPTLAQIITTQTINISPNYFKTIHSKYHQHQNIIYKNLSTINNILIHQPKKTFYQITQLPITNSKNFIHFILNNFQLNNTTTIITPNNKFYTTPNINHNKIHITYILNEHNLNHTITTITTKLKTYQNHHN